MSQTPDQRVVVGIVIGFVVALILANREGRLWRGPGPEPATMPFEDDDVEMNAAMKQSRQSVDVLLEALGNRSRSRSHLSVKVGFHDDNGGECVWLSDVSYRDGAFRGAVANVPEIVRSVRYGDRVTVSKDKIADWMFIEDGQLVGGFTMRDMRSRLSPEERAKFDANIGFKID